MAKKQIVRLTEGDLHRIIKESVNKILKETFTFNDVDPDGGVSYGYDEASFIENGEYDEELKKMTPRECDEWVENMDELYGMRTGSLALKRAVMVNKEYAMDNKRQRNHGHLHYNDYRSPNFYKGPHSYANALNKPTPFGMEEFHTKWKYGEQPEDSQRPSVMDYNFPSNDSNVSRLYDKFWDKVMDIDDDEERRKTWKRGLNDNKIKHKYNGRNPDTQKLHTKGSLNRELRAMDKAKK